MPYYIVTLAAKATTKVWVEAASANDARLAAEALGEPMMPWAPEAKPAVRRVEKVSP
jgi:hypothetical protein